jgi:hypothetical protein
MSASTRATAGLSGLWLFLFCTPLALEAATFTVTNVGDAGPGTLRWAITSANGSFGFDVIDFNIPGPGPFTITPLTALPQISDPTGGVFIDGLTQPGSNPGPNPPSTATLMIELDGSLAGPAHGLWVVSPGNMIQGLVINRWQQDGIRIQATPNGTFMNGVAICFIGTDPTGTIVLGNGWNLVQLWSGVSIICTPQMPGLAFDNWVDSCLISDNYSEGVTIANCPPGDVHNNAVTHCLIGTDVFGFGDFGNRRYGVYIGEGAHHNHVLDNVIAGNDQGGVSICGYAAIGVHTYANDVHNNAIGLAIDRLTPLPNSGNGVDIGQWMAVQEGFAPDNRIELNQIAWNTGSGVAVWEHSFTATNADSNLVSMNSIYANGQLGIDLIDDGVTFNDPGDPDGGPNQLVNMPLINAAVYSSGTGLTTITGTIDIDTPPTLAQVETFKARPDPSGCGEGEVYLGTAIPDAAGSWTIAVTGLAVGDSVTATTIDLRNDTSEFSHCTPVTPSTGAWDGLAGLTGSLRLDPARPNPFSGSTEIEFAVPAGSKASLGVYDVAGRLVKVLAEASGPTIHRVHWDGRNESGFQVASGVYLVRLDSAERTATRRLVYRR